MDDQIPGPRIPHPSTQDDGKPFLILDMTPSFRQVASVLGAVTAAVCVGLTWAAALTVWVVDAVAATAP